MIPARAIIPAVLFALAVASPGVAQPGSTAARLAQAVDAAGDQVRQATDELNALRDDVAARREPLAAELDALQSDVARLRRDADRLSRLRRQNDVEREAQRQDVQRMQEDFDFSYTLLQEYRRAFETRQEAPESIALRPQLEKIDRGLGRPVPTTDFLAAADALLRLAEAWNIEKLGGATHDGACLDPGGTSHEGRFAVLGPVAYFAAGSGIPAGLVVSRVGSIGPSLLPNQDAGSSDAIAALVQGGEQSVPLDPTGGDALRVAAGKGSFADHLVAGGFVMIPLLLIGLVAVLLTCWKVATLRRVNVPGSEVLDRIINHIQADRFDEAKAVVDQLRPPFRSVLSAGVEYHDVRKEHLEEIMHERAMAMIPILDRHLGMLAVLGGVAPLLGLLGTVTGMIETFELVTIFGTGDAKLLSGGISEALVTTETGLMIAVPVLLIHAYLARRVRGVISELEKAVVGFTNRLHRMERTGS